MSRAWQTEAINHSRAQIFVVTYLFSIDALAYVAFDQCALVISSDVAHDFYCDGVATGVAVAVITVGVPATSILGR